MMKPSRKTLIVIMIIAGILLCASLAAAGGNGPDPMPTIKHFIF